MKICLISQNVFPGILLFRKDFIQYMVSQGHDVYAFAIDYCPQTIKSVQDIGAVPIAYSLDKSGLNPLSDLKNTYVLSRKLKEISPDVVLSFFVKPSIFGTLAAKLAGVPCCCAMLEGLGYIHTQTPQGFSPKKRVLQVIHGILSTFGYFFADKVIFLNRDDPITLSKFAWISNGKIEILGPIGLRLEEYPFRPVDLTKPLRFIFVARLLAEKGIFEFLEAAKLVKRAYPDTQFVILGGLDPANPASLSKAQLKKVVADDLVIYPGHVSNVVDWISDAHVFVLPSYREGFPRSTQEAMAIGRAVITTDVPGCRDSILDGVNGFIVPPFDFKILSQKMLHLVNNKHLIKSMGAESNKIATDRFDSRKANALLLNIITDGKHI